MKEFISRKVMSHNYIDNTSTNTIEKKEDLGVFIKPPPPITCEMVKEFRGNLISNMAHDLRTPLQSILGYSETMLNKPDLTKEDKTKYLEIILNSTKNLSSMINHFFEYSRYEISDIHPNKEAIPIDSITQNLYETYESICPEKDICFKIKNEENLPPINGDYMMLYRVFQNLIDNAIKFTPEGGIVDIAFTKSSDSKIKVQISDTGAGISPEELDSIFNKFQMAKSLDSEGKTNKGLGLGLAIVKKILNLHNSEIFVKSTSGVGTTFTFFLPIH